ncbi:carbohydrate diacid regulator [Bifidobacterium bohemicum]|uniref:Putative sugar diacid recognition n=1 Tax=Bifidobacterium bohemicum DSM 22767 TaxID=1437606 RepID=A0A086ZGW7_9BIFI|nr:sugar diacid recognition domain-containing protein [Bifidobacterium bohemicum]KFI45767.1 putative sugar diacid recognition [Bifidobacterium bohemicum DSM 22767]SCC11627.1 carbohydrate diacid regulator [Bifidobacterium bohemicum]
MDIDPKIAEEIVANIKGVLRHEINLFDTSGTIIASTDKTRIGTGHDGARMAVRLKRTVPIDNEHQFKGAKNGINVPVLLNDSVVAVIGITGSRNEVEPFGNIIKKMTEILIRENVEQVTRFDQRMMMSNLINMLTTRRDDPGLVDYLSSMLGIDLTHQRWTAVGRLRGDNPAFSPQERFYSTLMDRFQGMPQSLFSVNTREICMLLDPADVNDPIPTLRLLQHDMEGLGVSAVFATGNLRETSYCWKSYDEAQRSADWLLFSDKKTIASYNELDFGLLVSSMSQDAAHHFVDRVFNGLTEEQIDEFHSIFEAYSRHNGSIIHAADELFLHKNTLQNRLNRIAAVTGYNPRTLKDYTILDMAFTLHDYLRFRASSQASRTSKT